MGCLLIGTVGLLFWISLQVGVFDFRNKTSVNVQFDNVAGLDDGAVVSMAGVQVGVVEGKELQNGRARVRLGIYSATGVLDSARARIRSRSVLGEKYIQLEDGSRDGSPIQENTELMSSGEQVEIDELLNVLGPLVASVDVEAIAVALEELSSALKKDPGRVAAIIENLDILMRNGAESSTHLPALLTKTDKVLSRSLGTLGRVERLSTRMEQSLDELSTVLGRGKEGLAGVPETLDNLNRTMLELEVLSKFLNSQADDVELMIDNLKELDKVELRRLLREEGVLLRLKARRVQTSE